MPRLCQLLRRKRRGEQGDGVEGPVRNVERSAVADRTGCRSWLRTFWHLRHSAKFGARLALGMGIAIGLGFASVYLVLQAREVFQGTCPGPFVSELSEQGDPILAEGLWRVDWRLLALSFLALLATFGWQAWVWKAMLKRLGYPLAYGQAYRIIHLSGLGAYVPGRVWQAVGVLALARREKIPARVSGMMLVLSNGLNLVAGSLFAMICYLLVWEGVAELPFTWEGVAELPFTWEGVAKLPFVGEGSGQPTPFPPGGAIGVSWWMLLVVVVGLVLTHPRLLEYGANWILARMRREPVQLDVGWSDTLAFVGLYAVNWIMYGGAFFLLVWAIVQGPGFSVSYVSWAAQVLGANAVAYVLGFVAVFAPAGIGVREVTLSGLLARVMPLEIAAVIAVIARLWFVSGQLASAVLALVQRDSIGGTGGANVQL